jgi:nucleoside-diphosphate-sugar epimerase
MRLTGPLEPTNEWYAVAEIAAIKLVEAYRRQHGADFISLMPTNLYGPCDNCHLEHGHGPAALIRRFHEALAHHLLEVFDRLDQALFQVDTGRPMKRFVQSTVGAKPVRRFVAAE